MKDKKGKTEEDNNSEQNLGELLLLLRRSILESFKKEVIKSDLTFSQIEILHFIGVTGEKTMKNIADYLKIKPPSATEIVKVMERKKLVRRIIGGKDRRVVMVALTNSTKKNYISMAKKKETILNKMISRVNEEDRKNLKRIIKIITEK